MRQRMRLRMKGMRSRNMRRFLELKRKTRMRRILRSDRWLLFNIFSSRELTSSKECATTK